MQLRGPRPTEEGWHEPANLSTYELDAVLSAQGADLMQALMNVGSSHEVLELEVGLLGHGADGPLEDLALPLSHSRMLRPGGYGRNAGWAVYSVL